MTSIEELSKTQIILLTLLVSFVTSIATGIITTSLLSEAPTSVTQTINRVVERTIEKAAPPSTTQVKLTDEAKAAVAVLEKATEATVRISEVSTGGKKIPLAVGVIASKDGFIVASNAGVKQDGVYEATLSDNTSLPITLVNISGTSDVAIFKINAANATTTPTGQ